MVISRLQFGHGNHTSPIRPDRELLARQRGNVSLSNLQVLNAILYVAEHGCKWRGLPKRFGNWHTIYTRMNRWSKTGRAGSGVRAVAAGADRAHQDRGRGAGQHHRQGASGRHRGAKKNGPQAIGKSRGGWTTKIHMVAADARTAITFRAVAGPGARRARGPRAAAPPGRPEPAHAPDHGPRLRGQRDPTTGARPGLHSGGAAQVQSSHRLGVRPRRCTSGATKSSGCSAASRASAASSPASRSST